MLTQAVITVTAADLGLDAFDLMRTKIWARTNIPGETIVDPTGDQIYLGASRGTVTLTTATVDVPVPGAGSWPAAWQTYIYVDYQDSAPGKHSKGHVVRTFGPFTITASVNLADLVAEQQVPPDFDSVGVLAQIEEIAGLTGEDGAIASRINTPGSATDVALKGAMFKVGPTPINVRQYGVASTNTAAQNDAALAALFADHTSGVMLAFPDLGTFNFSAPLPSRSLMQIQGRGRQTVLNWTTGNMLNITGTTLAQVLRFQDVKLTNSGTASHLISVTGTGGLIHTTFERCFIQPGVNGASIMRSDAYNLFGITFRDCLLHRNATATVPAFDLIGIAGSGTNNVHIEGGEWHSHECASTPFFKADANTASPLLNMTFEKIIGEQNNGGLIHIGGASFVRVYDVVDYDVTTAYTDDLFKFTAGTGGAECHVVDVDRSGCYSGFGIGGGKAHLRITGGVGHKVGWIPKNASQQGTLILPAGYRGVSRQGPATAEVPPYELVGTLPVTMTMTQHTVLVSVAGTITLPSTSTVMVGQEFRIKAVAASGCTVSGNGANIDGTATKTLAQYEVMNALWDGSSWRRL